MWNNCGIFIISSHGGNFIKVRKVEIDVFFIYFPQSAALTILLTIQIIQNNNETYRMLILVTFIFLFLLGNERLENLVSLA